MRDVQASLRNHVHQQARVQVRSGRAEGIQRCQRPSPEVARVSAVGAGEMTCECLEERRAIEGREDVEWQRWCDACPLEEEGST